MLKEIQRLVSEYKIIQTKKVRMELDACGLELDDILHIILAAGEITATFISDHPMYRGDILYVITGQAINGEWIYVKGKIEDGLLVLISTHPDR